MKGKILTYPIGKLINEQMRQFTQKTTKKKKNYREGDS